MLQPKKKITKQELKEDKFITDIFKAREYFETHTKEMTYLMGGVLIILATVFLWRYQNRKEEKLASYELTTVVDIYLQKNYQEAIGKLNGVIEKRRGTRSAGIAVFYLANSYFHILDYNNAAKYFQKYIDQYNDDDILSSSSHAGLGACKEQVRDFINAANHYYRGAKKYSYNFDTIQNLFNAGRCYQKGGEKGKAREVFEQILKEYPETNLKPDIEFYTVQLY